MRKRGKELLILALLLLPALVTVLPLFLLLTGSLMDVQEIRERLMPVFTGEGSFFFTAIPDYPTFLNYEKLLLETPQFFALFWNSMRMTGAVLAGQLLVAVPAAFGFAVYKGKGSRLLFSLYTVLMLIPFQVTMLSSYLVLTRLHLMNTQWAVILPAVFSAFPVFLCYGGFSAIPQAMLEAARIDGAGEAGLFLRIGLPLGRGGICSALILGFLECFNLIEQPMAFLDDKSLWPLSLYLPQISLNQAATAFCGSVIMLIPVLFVFGLFHDDLEQGIVYAGLKE